MKSLSALRRGIPSKHAGDSYYLNCFHSYSTENKLKKHKNVCKNHDYCYAEMPNEGNKILKYNHGEKFMKLPFILYADLESLLEKMITCHNNPEKSSTLLIVLRYKTSKEIPIVFHNGSTYDYHFIIKELAKEFEGQFECLGENTEKYITFSVPIKKELDNGKTIIYKLKFIDSFRFMSTSLSKIYLTFIAKNVEVKQLKPMYGLTKKFLNTYKFPNNDINKFILVLRKGVYPYK